MPGIRTLRKIQMGKETTAGTAVAATVIYRGQGLLNDDRVITPVEEDIGQMVDYPRAYIPKLDASVVFDSSPATFEQLGYWLAAGIEGVAGSQDGSGSGYIYQHDLANSAAQTPYYWTIEGGDNQREDEMEYSFVESFTMNGAADEAVMVSGTWRGRQATDAAFTTGLTPETVEEILQNKGKLYIDAAGGTIGTTQKTATWLGWTLNVVTGFQGIPAGDGNLYFSSTKQVKPEVTGELILEHDATGEAEITAARAKTGRLIRMQWEGSAFTTAGTTYTYKTLQINMAVQYTDVPTMGEDEGNDTITLPFRIVDSDSTQLQFINVPALTALV